MKNMDNGMSNAAGVEPAKLERATYSVEEAAKVLGLSRWAAYEAVKNKEIPTIRIGRRLLIPRAGLDRLLATA
jgi:excisionase family DNA binding protein